MSEAAPRLSVIIVTWNSADVIAGCLATLRASAIAGAVETIVIDNASGDATCALIAAQFPWVRLLRSAENLGFAAANNRAIAAARGASFLLLNPDVELRDPTAVETLLAVLAADPAIAIVGPRLTFGDGRHQVGDGGFRPQPATMICHGLGLGHVFSGLPSLYLVRPDRFAQRPVDVDWICGACLLVRPDAVAAAGGLDERMFMYAEDVEWGCRMRRQGWRVVYVPWVHVVHLQGASEAQAAPAERVSVRWLDSLLALSEAESGGRWRRTVRAAFAMGFLARALALSVRGKRDDHRRAHALRTYARAALQTKVFCFFSSEKKNLLS